MHSSSLVPPRQSAAGPFSEPTAVVERATRGGSADVDAVCAVRLAVAPFLRDTQRVSYAVMDSLGVRTAEAFRLLNELVDTRTYDAAGVILTRLGGAGTQLLSNNPAKTDTLTRAGIDTLTRAGISVVAPEGIVGTHNRDWHGYLTSKAEAFGHLIGQIPVAPAETDEVRLDSTRLTWRCESAPAGSCDE